MKKLLTISVVVALTVMLAVLVASPPNVRADAFNQSDHVDMDLRDDGAVYCGVGKNAEPWILHVAVTNNDTVGRILRIEVQDGSGTNFNLPAASSFSFTQAFGGVPGVDNIIRITSDTEGDVEGVASALATGGAKDPFEGDGEKDNFCFSLGEGVDGISTDLEVSDSWVVDGDGSDGGELLP